jgi:2-polyprenyl-6-methoxyphenol hydroxylase-like FAD-dependent oxidoreductase
MVDRETDVLVVGGGITGLSTALFLAWQGVRVQVVERNSAIPAHPRARGLNLRAMEVFRQAGLEDALRAVRSHVAHRGAWTMVRAQTMAGPETFSKEMSAPVPMNFWAQSPSEWIPIDQDAAEALILERARALGARVDFGTELRGLEQDDTGVTATTYSGGVISRISARYAVGADGYGGPVRRLLGIPMEPLGPTYRAASIVFEADLTDALRGRRIGLLRLDEPQPGTMLMPYDGRDRWCMITGYAGEDQPPEPYPVQRCVELVRAAIGVPDLPVRILPQLPADGVTALTYPIGAAVASAMRAGRVFLAGDAAHLMPPSGAFGASTGVQDGHNLAWKLAAVLSGAADPALLDTYESERLPVARRTVAHAQQQTSNRNGSTTGGPAEAEYGAVVFGYRYPVGDGPDEFAPADLTGQPGSRAPHAWLEGDGDAPSTLDLFGRGFVLLATDPRWEAAASRAGTAVALLDPYDVAAQRYRTVDGGAVLVRPDGFVVWRTDTFAEDAERQLADAVDRALCRVPQRVPA